MNISIAGEFSFIHSFILIHIEIGLLEANLGMREKRKWLLSKQEPNGIRIIISINGHLSLGLHSIPKIPKINRPWHIPQFYDDDDDDVLM